MHSINPELTSDDLKHCRDSNCRLPGKMYLLTGQPYYCMAIQEGIKDFPDQLADPNTELGREVISSREARVRISVKDHASLIRGKDCPKHLPELLPRE